MLVDLNYINMGGNMYLVQVQPLDPKMTECRPPFTLKEHYMPPFFNYRTLFYL